MFRLQTQMFDPSDPHSYMGSLAPLQSLPGAAQLDMNVSCLFMHEVNFNLSMQRSKYRIFFF